MVKQVSVSEALLKEYKDEDIIHFLAKRMRLCISELSGDTIKTDGEKYGELLVNMTVATDYLEAVDKRMNKESDDPKFAM